MGSDLGIFFVCLFVVKDGWGCCVESGFEDCVFSKKEDRAVMVMVSAGGDISVVCRVGVAMKTRKLQQLQHGTRWRFHHRFCLYVD